jgi:hypothetical protein
MRGCNHHQTHQQMISHHCLHLACQPGGFWACLKVSEALKTFSEKAVTHDENVPCSTLGALVSTTLLTSSTLPNFEFKWVAESACAAGRRWKWHDMCINVSQANEFVTIHSGTKRKRLKQRLDVYFYVQVHAPPFAPVNLMILKRVVPETPRLK